MAVNGKPRMRIMTWPPLERKACASELLPVRQVIIHCIGINLSAQVSKQDYFQVPLGLILPPATLTKSFPVAL